MTEPLCPPPIPPNEWHVAIDGQAQGPCSLSDLARFARDGRITPQSLVWKEGLAQWQPANTIPQVASIFAPAAPPPIRMAIPRPVSVNHPPRSSGLSGWVILLIVLGCCVPVFAILAAIAVPNFLEAQTRSKVARARSDLRTFSIALETYYLDQNDYPAWTADPARKIYGESSPANHPGFMRKQGEPDPLMTLTTPLAYMTIIPADPFAPNKGATFSYWTPPLASKSAASLERGPQSASAPEAKTGFIIWSTGPDMQYDLDLNNIAQAYDPGSTVPSPFLINRTFDPTNGTNSGGDIWRTKM